MAHVSVFSSAANWEVACSVKVKMCAYLKGRVSWQGTKKKPQTKSFFLLEMLFCLKIVWCWFQVCQ